MKVRVKFSMGCRIWNFIHKIHVLFIRLIAGWDRPMIFNWKFPEEQGLEIRQEHHGCYIVGCSFEGVK